MTIAEVCTRFDLSQDTLRYYEKIGFWLPIICATTTAPPVDMAINILINKTLTISTSETPDTAASPAYDNNMVDTMLTKTSRIWSRNKGSISFRNDWVLNIGFFLLS